MFEHLKIHVLGASCSGVSTLGALLSEKYGIPQIDVDNFYWMPTDPPFTTKRPPQDRINLISNIQDRSDGWVLTGSFMGWGDALIKNVDLIVFIHTPTPIRLERLDKREFERHGARIRPSGDMHETHIAFRDWAAQYDDPLFTGRNIAQHEVWLKKQPKPIIRINGSKSTEELVRIVTKAVSEKL